MNILVLIGLTAIGFICGIYEFRKLQKVLKAGVKVRGRRIGYATITDSDNCKVDVPMLEFVDSTGRIIKTKIETNFFNKKDEIDIIYDVNNPKKVIENYWTKHISWIFCMAFGLISLIFLLTELASR